MYAFIVCNNIWKSDRMYSVCVRACVRARVCACARARVCVMPSVESGLKIFNLI